MNLMTRSSMLRLAAAAALALTRATPSVAAPFAQAPRSVESMPTFAQLAACIEQRL